MKRSPTDTASARRGVSESVRPTWGGCLCRSNGTGGRGRCAGSSRHPSSRDQVVAAGEVAVPDDGAGQRREDEFRPGRARRRSSRFRKRRSISSATPVHGPWLSASPQARRATPRPSRPSWLPSAFREAAPDDRGAAPMPSSRTARTHPARSEVTSANAESALSSPRPPTGSATGCGEAARAVDRRLSTRSRTSSATRWSDASIASSSGAAWPCGPTSSPSPTRPRSSLPRSSSGHGDSPLSERPPNVHPRAKSPCQRCAPRA